MDGTRNFFRSPTGRVMLVGVGFLIWMIAMLFVVGLLQVLLIALGVGLMIVAAAMGSTPSRDPAIRYRRDPESGR